MNDVLFLQTIGFVNTILHKIRTVAPPPHSTAIQVRPGEKFWRTMRITMFLLYSTLKINKKLIHTRLLQWNYYTKANVNHQFVEFMLSSKFSCPILNPFNLISEKKSKEKTTNPPNFNCRMPRKRWRENSRNWKLENNSVKSLPGQNRTELKRSYMYPRRWQKYPPKWPLVT